MTVITCFRTRNNEIFITNNKNLNQEKINKLFILISTDNMKFNFYRYNFSINKFEDRKRITFILSLESVLLCNPLYDINIYSKKTVLIKYFEKYSFKNIKKFKGLVNKYSKIISFNHETSENIYNKYFPITNIYYPINKIILNNIFTKINFYNILKKFNMLNWHPKTYLNYFPVTNSQNQKNYFLKYPELDAQKGIFVGNLDYLKKICRKKNFMIQESIDNCLKCHTNRRIVFGMWFTFSKSNYYIYKKTTEIGVDKTINNNIQMVYNLLNDYNIKDFNIILTNMINICETILKKLLQINVGEIKQNQYSLCRMDFIIEENTYKPYILEVNYNIDLNGKESHKDSSFCEYFIKNKVFDLLYNNGHL